MDLDTQIALDKIQKAIAVGNGELGAKLDMANQQFNAHLTADAVSFTTLTLGQKAIETTIQGDSRRRAEESERVARKQRQKEEDEVTRAGDVAAKKFQWRLAMIAGAFAVVAALAGSLLASLLSYYEAKAARLERTQERIEERKKSP